MKTVFFGSSPLVIPIIETLKKYFGLTLVITKNTTDPIVKYCKENDISFVIASKINADLKDQVKNTKAEIGIIADFGLILPQKVLDLFPSGILNVHPSLLPNFRGPTPIQTAILENEINSGVTLFKLDDKVDHGPIIAQEEFEFPKDSTTPDLLKILFKLGANLIEAHLEDYFTNDISLTDQDDSKATFTKIITKQDGYIDVSNPPDKQKLDQMIRAYYPWPGVWIKFKLNDKEVVIKLLPNEQIQVEGKKPMSYKDFINGYPNGELFLQKLSLI